MDKDPLLIPQVSPSLVSVLQVDIENARCYSITRYRTSRAVTKLDTSGPHRHAILDRCRRTTWLPLTRRTTCELWCYLPPGRPSPALVCPRSFGPPHVAAQLTSRSASLHLGPIPYIWFLPSSRTLVPCKMTVGDLHCCASHTIRFACIARPYSMPM